MQNFCAAGFVFFVFSAIGQNTILIDKYQNKVRLYLDKENALGGYYLIDSSGISIYKSPETKSKQVAEYKVYWDETNFIKLKFRKSTSDELLMFLSVKGLRHLCYDSIKGNKPDSVHFHFESVGSLKGLRIAIDPGHLANNAEMARMEKKIVEIKASPDNGLKHDIQLIESRLTFETASLLKEKLEKAGAVVMISRPKNNVFDEWLISSFKTSLDTEFMRNNITEEERNFLLLKATKKEILRKFYVNLETKERARRINAFDPDFTVIIHYNADDKNTGWTKPTRKDFNMTFTGGSYMKNEMERPVDRAEFLRLLLTDDIENSIRFSSFFVKSFETNLAVPTAKQVDADYLAAYCLPTSETGVFCRNLMMTRLVHGTLVYGETLCQDNLNEIHLLSEKGRVEQVANAYYEGIENYVKNVLH